MVNVSRSSRVFPHQQLVLSGENSYYGGGDEGFLRAVTAETPLNPSPFSAAVTERNGSKKSPMKTVFCKPMSYYMYDLPIEREGQSSTQSGRPRPSFFFCLNPPKPGRTAESGPEGGERRARAAGTRPETFKAWWKHRTTFVQPCAGRRPAMHSFHFAAPRRATLFRRAAHHGQSLRVQTWPNSSLLFQ